MVVVGLVTGSVGLVIDRWGGSLVWWLIGGSGGDWWFDLFMWVSDCRVGWLVGLIGDHWLGLLLVWVSDLLKSGLLGSTCLRWFFLGLRFFFFFFCLGWLCCIFGLIWYFGALGFDDFVRVWENCGFEIYDFVFELNFLGFFVCLFPKKYFGFACSFAGEEHEVHVLGKKKCSYEKKK